MTRNQLEYLSYLEAKRANQAKEKETFRSNSARETETERSNRANESLNLINSNLRAGELAETVRSNKAREYETSRSNLENERIKRYTAEETKRSNLARELETNRSNVAREQETKRANLMQEWYQQQSQNETRRSNIARETETHRANVAKETETNRSNIAREQETRRSNLANEFINQDRNDLTRQHYERSDYETERANRAREYLTAEQNAIKREEIALGYSEIDQKEAASMREYEASIYGSNASAAASRYSADARYGASIYAAYTSAATQWGAIAEQNRHNQATEFNQQLGISSEFRTKSEQNEIQRQNISNQQSRWEGESANRAAQAAYNSERAKTEAELRNARKHNIYSDTVNNYTRSFANVWSTITGGNHGKKK